MSDGKTPKPPDFSWTDYLKNDFFCAIVTGFATAAFFNPWDKALYLSIKDRRPFLDRRNWRQPFSGTLQAVTCRTLNTGLYFPLESLFHEALYSYYGSSLHVDLQSEGQPEPSETSDATSRQQKPSFPPDVETVRDGALAAGHAPGDDCHGRGGRAGRLPTDGQVVKPRAILLFAAGNLAGVTCAVLSHPLSVTKYACWNGSDQSFLASLRELYTHGGAVTLYRGFVATMARDCLFGGIYASLRHYLMSTWGPSLPSGESLKGDLQNVVDKNSPHGRAMLRGFVLNTFAACVAVAASSPLNYVRNMQLAALPDARELPMLPVLRGFCEQVAKASGTSAKVTVVTRSLLLGWGSLRAAVGMGFGSLVYDFCKNNPPEIGW